LSIHVVCAATGLYEDKSQSCLMLWWNNWFLHFVVGWLNTQRVSTANAQKWEVQDVNFQN
jgi:hypothetical protein